MANQSIFNAFERMWLHVVAKFNDYMSKNNPSANGIFTLNGDIEGNSSSFYQEEDGLVVDCTTNSDRSTINFNLSTNDGNTHNVHFYTDENENKSIIGADRINTLEVTTQSISSDHITSNNIDATNLSCDNILSTYEEVAATTETGNFADAKALAETINKMKNMMCKTYELQCSVAVTSNYTITDVTAFLIGNNLSMYFSIERNANTSIGNVANEVIADVIITHNGKISGIRGASFGAGASGGVTSFYMGEPNLDDNTVDFKIALGATTVAEKKWTTYVTFPVRINMDAY